MDFIRTLLLWVAAHRPATADLKLRHLNLRAPGPARSIHFVYTTGCDDYQLTHSVVLDHSWQAVGNLGRLTRVVAGCKTPEARELLSRSPLVNSSDFAVFFAIGELDQIVRTGEQYPARSRPHALSQWFTAANPSEGVIALVDPDFLFLRPLWQHPSLAQVRRGRMVSSPIWWSYGDTSTHDIPKAYKTGPLWLISTRDLHDLLPEWADLTDTWPKKGDGLMREQFAFQASARKHRVRAVFAEDLSPEIMHHSGASAEPYALHYFRSYGYGRWSFHKALSSSGWYADHFNNSVPPPIACGAPLLQEPPQPPPGEDGALTMHTLIPRMNAAFRALRGVYCPGEGAAFQRGGPAAFGLVRLMHPITCAGRAGTRTRYRVPPRLPGDWQQEQALSGDRCSSKAQAHLSELAHAP